MKQKSLFITLFVLTLFWGFALYECTRAATISTWTHDAFSGEYAYHYELPGEISGRGLSNAAITIPCFEVILGGSPNVPFQIDTRDQINQLVIEGFPDDLPETFTVTLYSLHPPVESEIELKAAQNRPTFPAFVHGCDGPEPIELGIPEPKTVLLAFAGIAFLLLRRKRTKPKS